MFKRVILNRVLAGAAVASMLILLTACGSGRSASSTTVTSSGAGAAGVMTAANSAKSLQPYTGSEQILVPDAAAKSVTINLIAAENNTADGFNFNGFARGGMIFRIPTGWKVMVNFTVASSVAHSALIVPYSERFSSLLHPSFPGGESPDYRGGITKGHPAQQFTFTADKAGNYAVVCGVPGHDNLGMWEGFDVVDGLSAPELLVTR